MFILESGIPMVNKVERLQSYRFAGKIVLIWKSSKEWIWKIISNCEYNFCNNYDIIPESMSIGEGESA